MGCLPATPVAAISPSRKPGPSPNPRVQQATSASLAGQRRVPADHKKWRRNHLAGIRPVCCCEISTRQTSRSRCAPGRFATLHAMNSCDTFAPYLVQRQCNRLRVGLLSRSCSQRFVRRSTERWRRREREERRVALRLPLVRIACETGHEHCQLGSGLHATKVICAERSK